MPRKSKAPKTETAEPNPALRIIFVILIAIQAFVSGLLIHALIKLNLLQGWQIFLFILVLLGFLLLSAYKLIISKKAGRISKAICLILTLLVTIAAAFGIKYVHQTINFVESVTGTHNETEIYQVRVLKTSSYKEISQLNRQHVGFLSTNPNLENTKNALKTAVDYKAKEYEEIGSLIASINDYNVAAVVLNQSYLDFLEESDSNFVEESVSIYEFKVLVDAQDNPSAVDVVSDPFILYISGSDSRGDITETARSDVNILMVVNPKTFKMLLVSIPRDYYVQLHGTKGTKDKLTHAGIYGIQMSKNTIQDLLDIDINYTAKVGFQTLTNVVDAVDGIEIDSDQAFKTSKCEFKKGKQKVNSECALAFARERYAYSSGDRHRGQNQQQIIAALIHKISDPHYLVRYSKILEAAQGSFETSLTYDEITNFAKYQLSELRGWKIESISLDGTGAMLPTYSMGAQPLYVMQPDMKTVHKAQKKINEYLSAE